MSELFQSTFQATRQRIEGDETVRAAVLMLATVALAIAFVALLISDEVHAAGL